MAKLRIYVIHDNIHYVVGSECPEHLEKEFRASGFLQAEEPKPAPAPVLAPKVIVKEKQKGK